METFIALLAVCSLVKFPRKASDAEFDVFFDPRLE